MKILITIVAYNRYNCLRLLLNTLSRISGSTTHSYDVLISIDFSSNQSAMEDIFNDFNWSYGKKHIQLHNRNIGLIDNVYYSADYFVDNGYDYIVMLEDDLLVSANLLEYVDSIISFDLLDNHKIAGYSLYSPRFNETSYKEFWPVTMCDNYFMQLPSSWGQVWSYNQWKRYREWTRCTSLFVDKKDSDSFQIPSNISRWSSKSWKKLFLYYLLKYDLYFFYPVNSITSNSGSSGNGEGDET